MTPLSPIPEGQHCAACNGNQDPYSHKEQAACRYYQTGSCRRGPSCPFAHVSVAAQAESPTIPHPPYLAGDHMYTYYPLGQTPVYHPLGSPVFVWQPYAPLSPSFDPRYGLVCQTENLPDYPDDKSDPSSAASSSTATSVDDQLRTSLDTAWSDGLEPGTTRGVANPPGDLGTNSSPGYASYNYSVFPGVAAQSMVGGDRATSGQYPDQGPMVALPSPFLLQWQEDPRKKPLAYKTKPCKFYAANGKCTSGEKCTFIHDPVSRETAKKDPLKLTSPTEAKLPPKPVDKYEDYRARDFYPITWRVIGGGVMMGGQRQTCPAFAAGRCKYGNDCRLAHETELEMDEVGYIEPKNEPVWKGKASPLDTTLKRVRSGSQRKPAKVSSPEMSRPVVFPSTPPRPQRPSVPALEGIGTTRRKSDRTLALSAPSSPVHRRTQSMSKVITSPLPLDTTYSSYAAEL